MDWNNTRFLKSYLMKWIQLVHILEMLKNDAVVQPPTYGYVRWWLTLNQLQGSENEQSFFF